MGMGRSCFGLLAVTLEQDRSDSSWGRLGWGEERKASFEPWTNLGWKMGYEFRKGREEGSLGSVSGRDPSVR